MSLTMTNEEREAFLADVHVAVISVAEDGHGPLVVPIWYSYEPGGEVRIITGRTSRKGKLLERAGRFSLCVQTETLPYKYVSVEGPIVAVEAADLETPPRAPLSRHRSGRLVHRKHAGRGRERACSYAARTMAHCRLLKAIPVTVNDKSANHTFHLRQVRASAVKRGKEGYDA